MKTLENARTWTDVPQPTNKNIVSSKWVFHIKHKSNRAIKKYKACLVTHRFTQRFRIDYFDTYSQLCVLPAYAPSLSSLCAMNGRSTHSTLTVHTSMANSMITSKSTWNPPPPPRYRNQGESVKFLLKSLYRLKQAGCKWYDMLVHTLADKSFHVSNADPGIFYAHDKEDITMLQLLQKLSQCFAILE